MDAPAIRVPPVIDVVPDRIELADPQPSSIDAQMFEADGSGSHAALQAAASAHLPDALRALLKRFNLTGAVPDPGKAADPAPAHAPDGGRFLEKVFSNQAGSRIYKLYVPSGYHGQALPLIVMLHGCTQSPDDFAVGTRMNVLAEAQNCFVVYPAQAVSANPSKCWNWFNRSDQQRERGEPSLIAGITREVMRDLAVDPRRVYVAGLSAGGAAAAVMGATYPDLYAAVGVHSGLACGAASDLPTALAAMRQGSNPSTHRPSGVSGGTAARRMLPTIVFHGDSDTTVHPRNGNQVIAQLQAMADGLQTSVIRGRVPDGHAYSRTLHADASGQPILEQWVVHGGGHAWSGGSPAGSYTDPQGPDATREMLRFFLQHRQLPLDQCAIPQNDRAD
jgi:poly(hydroxyalkanoate) depolymerase family esterase